VLKYIYQTFKQIDKSRKRYLGLIIGILLLFASTLSSLFAYQFDNINRIHAENSREQMINIKKDILKDTVNNVIRYIEDVRHTNEERFRGRIKRLIIFIEEHAGQYGIDHISDYLQNGGVNEDLVIIIKDSSGDTVYESPTAIEYRSADPNTDYFISETIEYDGHTIFMGALNSRIKTLVETALRNRVYNDLYFEDAYLWVNEVVDYAGGDDYGIRLIHPNLKETEGMLLSTEMEDIAGGKPYLEELEGVKKEGELFFTYYFKKLTSDSIEQKITFAKLYADYNWILAMGVYYDNLEANIATAAEQANSERQAVLIIVGSVTVLLILIGTIAFILAERMYYSRSTKPLKTEVETDLLTGAGSRRAALKTIADGFNRFKAKGGVYNLLIIDLDDFKHVNDTYGHEIGDRVLIRVVQQIKSVIRDEDGIYRWGGEEFVLFTKGITKDNLDSFMSKILQAVEQTNCKVENLDIKTTVSIGAACFKNSDESYNDALKRADDAMYQSKRNGKNRGTQNC
jgi:diguanylate cyclase (GGDEF)-like protein